MNHSDRQVLSHGVSAYSSPRRGMAHNYASRATLFVLFHYAVITRFPRIAQRRLSSGLHRAQNHKCGLVTSDHARRRACRAQQLPRHHTVAYLAHLAFCAIHVPFTSIFRFVRMGIVVSIHINALVSGGLVHRLNSATAVR